jgi:hypothetical protein
MARLTVVVEHVLALIASIGCLVVVLASVGGHCMTIGEACRFGSGSDESCWMWQPQRTNGRDESRVKIEW